MPFRKQIVGLSLLLVFGWVLSAHVWYSPVFSGKVVDENGSPVSGASVLVTWRLRSALAEAPHPPMRMAEGISDKKGEFLIDGWGPIFEWSGRLRGDEPKIYVVHDDFLPAILPNTENLARLMEMRSMDVSPSESVVIKLKSRRGVSRQSAERQEGFFISMISNHQVGVLPRSCVWKDVPRFHAALLKLVESASKDYKTSIDQCS